MIIKFKKLVFLVFAVAFTTSTLARDLSQVRFSIDGPDNEPVQPVIEDLDYLASIGKEHTEKYYAYMGLEEVENYDYEYHDVTGRLHKMLIDKNAAYNNIIWNKKRSAKKLYEPYNYDLYYGVDVSRHNGNIDWKKVKDAGFDFAFIRIVYRGYGKKGTLLQDELAINNLKNAAAAGLKIGAYVFSQSIDENETIEEAELATKMLNDNNIVLDLPLVYDPETIKNDTARTDDIDSEIFTRNTITFCEYIKSQSITPAVYSNMIWEDYYFDMTKLKDYDFWYADYEDFPQTPYRYKYWQFSERGKVDGINGYVDLNVMLVEK